MYLNCQVALGQGPVYYELGQDAFQCTESITQN